jgi:phosphatidylglycerol:prolipoprotein diacylglycerol transferase
VNPDGILHHPTVFQLGPVELTGFGLAVLAAFALSQLVCQYELTRRGQLVEANAMPDLVLAALLGTLIGAKSYYVVLTGDISAFLSRGGFVFWGGFIGSVVLCWITIAWKKLSFARFADVAGIAIAAGYSVGRTGCWAVGDDYGRPWSGPFSARFPEGAPPSTVDVMRSQFGVNFPADLPGSTVVAVHPTQLYETVMGFGMFLVLWALRKHTRRPGWLFGVYCVLAGAERFVVEFFRAKDDQLSIGITTAQSIALTVLTVGVLLLVALRRPSLGSDPQRV